MSTYTSIHPERSPKIEASSSGTTGAPFQIRIVEGYTVVAEVCVFTGCQEYTDALVAAINAVKNPMAEAADLADEAA